MNIAASEIPASIVAKTCGCTERGRKVTYALLDSSHGLCLDKKDIISAQLEACERLLKYVADQDDSVALEQEIKELKIALDLMT